MGLKFYHVITLYIYIYIYIYIHVCKDFGIKNVAEYHDLYLSECPFLMPGARGVFDPHINRAKTFGTPT